MEFTSWLSLLAVCLLGAMSPGPSLAVVFNTTMRGGRSAGYVCALTHGFGVALYGLFTVAGLAALIANSPLVFSTLQILGAAYLIYLGIKSLRSKGAGSFESHTAETGHGAALNGFMVAFLNPKLAVFMLALFSQFLSPDAQLLEKGIMVATVGISDASWYLVIVTLITRKNVLEKLRSASRSIDRVYGVILIILALSVLLPAVYKLMA